MLPQPGGNLRSGCGRVGTLGPGRRAGQPGLACPCDTIAPVWSYLGAMTLLGGLGFDPAPMLISVAALSLGARRRKIILFATVLVLGTAAWGVAVTLVAGPAIRHVHWLALAESVPGLVAATLVAVALLAWGVVTLRTRWHRANLASIIDEGDAAASAPARQSRAASGIAAGPLPLLLVALAFIAVVLSDPPFPTAIVLSAHRSVVEVVLGFLIWAAVSQSPVVVLAVALSLGVGERFVVGSRRVMSRVAPLATMVVAGACVVAGAALLVWVAVRAAG